MRGQAYISSASIPLRLLQRSMASHLILLLLWWPYTQILSFNKPFIPVFTRTTGPLQLLCQKEGQKFLPPHWEGLTLEPESGTSLVQGSMAKLYILLEEFVNLHFAGTLSRKNWLVLIWSSHGSDKSRWLQSCQDKAIQLEQGLYKPFSSPLSVALRVSFSIPRPHPFLYCFVYIPFTSLSS